MGLSYLSKKSWHPSTFANIEQVWSAEQKEKDKDQKIAERVKKLREEKEIEDLKRIQIKEGIIPESSLQRLDWMYQDRSAQQAQSADANDAEKFLLGEAVKKLPDQGGKKGKPEYDTERRFGELANEFACPENEAFVKMVEDPLVYIKQKELEARHSVFDNPLKMKQIKEEIERLKNGGKKKKDKKKKSKKDKKKSKKHKKRKRSSSSDSSSSNGESDRDSSEASRNQQREYYHDRKSREYHDHHRRERSHSHERTRNRDNYKERSRRDDSSERSRKYDKSQHYKSRRSRSREYEKDRNRYYDDRKYDNHTMKQYQTENLGPDMNLYGERKRQLEEMEQLRKKQNSQVPISKLTEEEKQRKLQEMMNFAKKVQEDKHKKLGIPVEGFSEKQDDSKKDAKFLRDLNKQVYMDSSMTLDERINRKAHYIDRHAPKDD